jgi:hypothetical protein
LGKACLHTIKKAIAIALPLVDSEGQPIHSGSTFDDIKEMVLSEMYLLLKGKNLVDEEIDHKDVPSDGERPSGWFFHGWMAFLLYGPLEPVSQRIPLLEVGKTRADGKNLGRTAQRKEGAKEKATVRKNDTEGQRGLTVEQQLGLDNLKCRQQEQAISKKETKLIALNMKASGIHTIERAENRALRRCPVYDENNEFCDNSRGFCPSELSSEYHWDIPESPSRTCRESHGKYRRTRRWIAEFNGEMGCQSSRHQKNWSCSWTSSGRLEEI